MKNISKIENDINKKKNQKIDNLRGRLLIIQKLVGKILQEGEQGCTPYVKEQVETIEMFSDLNIDVKIGDNK